MTNNERGTVAQAIDAVSAAVHAMPPAFIALTFMNVAFVAALFWYLHVQQADRTDLLRQVLETCIPKGAAR